jgi:F-box-like
MKGDYYPTRSSKESTNPSAYRASCKIAIPTLARRKRHPGLAFDVLPPEEGSLLLSPVYQQGELDQYGVHLNNLPPELLGKIFIHCLPPRVWQPPFPKVREAPMLLCQVCRYWRELALSLPMLWSSVSGSMGHGLEAFRQWLHSDCSSSCTSPQSRTRIS